MASVLKIGSSLACALVLVTGALAFGQDREHGGQPEHGVGDNMSADQAKMVRDARGMPEFVFNPRKGETSQEAFDLKGNPSMDNLAAIFSAVSSKLPRSTRNTKQARVA